MNTKKTFEKIRELETKLTYASPGECARLTDKLVKLKTKFVCE